MFEQRFKILSLIYENRSIIIPVFLFFVMIFLVIAIISPNKYTSEAVLLPSGFVPSGMQFVPGFSITEFMSGAQTEISSFLFPDILKSKKVILKALETPFDSSLIARGYKGNLKEFFRWGSTEKAIKGFKGKSKIKYSFEKGLVQLKFTCKDPFISKFALEAWISALEDFINEHTALSAKKKYAYLKRREEKLVAQLDSAENELKRFIATHRNYSDDPILTMQYQRYRSKVDLTSELINYVRKQLEVTMLDMKGAAPIINILDEPNLPKSRSGPKRSLIVLSGAIIGFVASIFAAAFRMWWISHRNKARPS